jgi:hypothetical protein
MLVVMTADIGPMLFRVLARSGLDTGTLARAAGVPESELVTVFDGAEPSGSAAAKAGASAGVARIGPVLDRRAPGAG